MAPRYKSTPVKNHRKQHETDPHGPNPIVNKPTEANTARESLSRQNKSLHSDAAHLYSVHSSLISLSPLCQPALTKRKPAEAENLKSHRPSKQPRYASSEDKLSDDGEVEVKAEEPEVEVEAEEPEVEVEAEEPEFHSQQPQEPPPLSDKDSQLLKSLYEKVMASPSSSALKRSLSQRSMTQSETGTNQTQHSSSTNFVYRRKNLAPAKIRFHADPTDDIEATIKGIVNAQVSEQRRAELRAIAQNFRKRCLRNVRAETLEDDFIRPLRTAIETQGLDGLCLSEKVPWRWELKPVVRHQSDFSSNFLAREPHIEAADGPSAPPRKRQQQATNENYISPEAPKTNIPTPPVNNAHEPSKMPPPPLPLQKGEGRSLVKTPHPDISLGIDLYALIAAVSSQDFPQAKVNDFIEWLQNEIVQHEKDGPFEPMLLLVPAPRAQDLAFPFVVAEGKAYSTGRQIYEAENQAAVSLACAHKILLCLDRIASAGKTGPSPTHILYSITTQGPIHELWAHWTVVEAGVRMFDSMLWDSWNGLVRERAEDFIVKLHNVCVWGTGTFMQEVVARLREVAVQARTSPFGSPG